MQRISFSLVQADLRQTKVGRCLVGGGRSSMAMHASSRSERDEDDVEEESREAVLLVSLMVGAAWARE